MNKIKKGDEVIIIAGKDRGKRGVVLAVLDKGKKLLIDGINIAKKHVKPNPNAGIKGGIEAKVMPIDASNVGLYDPATGKVSKVGIRVQDGQRVRFYKASGQLIDVKA